MPRLTEALQLSPAKEMAEVKQQVTKNVQAMQTGSAAGIPRRAESSSCA